MLPTPSDGKRDTDDRRPGSRSPDAGCEPPGAHREVPAARWVRARAGIALAMGLAGAAFLVAGCLPDDQGAGANAPDVDDLPGLVLEEFARIGSVDDPDYGFSRIGSVDVDRDGNVYVQELQDREIRVYSPEGALLRRLGGPGDGPGEFAAGVSTLRFGVHGDTVWTFDRSPQRITLFDRSGQLLSATRADEVSDTLHGPGQWVRLEPRYMDSSGLLVGDRGMSSIGEPGGPVADTAWIRFIRFDGSGEVVDTVGSYPVARPASTEITSVGSSRFILPRPPGGDRRLITHAHGYIHIDQAGAEGEGVFRVTRLGRGGDTIRSRTFRFEPKPYPDEVLNEHATTAGHRVGQLFAILGTGELENLESRAEDTAAARRAILGEMPFPRFQYPVRATFHTASDALWLRREDMGGEHRYTVLDPEDRPVGEFEVSPTTRLGWSDGDVLWTIEPDELDVQWLVGYRIRSGG